MKSAAVSCGIVIPVCNEAQRLPETVPGILSAGRATKARIIWVCNGCTDDSFQIIKNMVGQNAEVLNLDPRGKTAALQAGDDQLGHIFPRFYVDADILIEGRDLSLLHAALVSGVADLVSPRYEFDCSGASNISQRIAECWMSLPHARQTAFHGVLGISEKGRAHWERWPDVVGDDAFAAATIPAKRQRLILGAKASSRSPESFAAWVRMRRRWSRGLVQLRKMELCPPPARGQKRALLLRLLRGPDRIGTCAFLAVRAASIAQWGTAESGWVPARY
ncbi:glycosyltransferase [Roseobacter cerasinus]|uniref:glycosyltransferase n=1 Tax=Roseobacter cerasinus TaxID=2602289 RepID=UPI0013583FF5|nr:glycosyltransferase [Roseobacter cerasinus]